MRAQLDLGTAGLDYLPDPGVGPVAGWYASDTIEEAVAAGRREPTPERPAWFDVKWWDRETGPHERAAYRTPGGASLAEVHAAIAQDVARFPLYPPRTDIYGRRVQYLEIESAVPVYAEEEFEEEEDDASKDADLQVYVSQPARPIVCGAPSSPPRSVEPVADSNLAPSPPAALPARQVPDAQPVTKRKRKRYASDHKPYVPRPLSLTPVTKRLRKPYGTAGRRGWAEFSATRTAPLPPASASRLRFARAKHATSTAIMQLERLGNRETKDGLTLDLRESRLRFLRAQREYLEVVCQERGSHSHEWNQNNRYIWQAQKRLSEGADPDYWQGRLARLQERKALLQAEYDAFLVELKEERIHG